MGVGRREDDSQFKRTFEIPQREVHKRSGKDGIPSTALQRKPMYICMYTTSVYTEVIRHKHTCMHRCTIFSNQTDEARVHWAHLHQ